MRIASERFALLSLSDDVRLYVEDHGDVQWLRFVRAGTEIRVRWDQLNEAYEWLVAGGASSVRPGKGSGHEPKVSYSRGRFVYDDPYASKRGQR